MNFPSDYPDDCPLDSAVDCNQSAFMVMKTLPPTADDFQSQAERGRALTAEGRLACMRHGLSIFPTHDDCAHHQQLFPRLGEYIGRADLRPEHGVVAATAGRNPNHMTWWPYEEVSRHDLFELSKSGEG